MSSDHCRSTFFGIPIDILQSLLVKLVDIAVLGLESLLPDQGFCRNTISPDCRRCTLLLKEASLKAVYSCGIDSHIANVWKEISIQRVQLVFNKIVASQLYDYESVFLLPKFSF